MSNSDNVEDREILNTKNMLEDGFFANLGKISKNPAVQKETTKETAREVALSPSSQFNTEKVLMGLFEARDGLVETYAKIGMGAYSQNFIDGINKIGSCIKALGGEVENFDPFTNMSGLQAPNLVKNAKRVIENTVEAYSLGKVSDANISQDGKIITMTFTGQNGTTNYKAVGTLTANKTWTGNEAIDYIYSTNSGRMSVKSFSDDGKWVDKSGNYRIEWELFEKESSFDVMPTEGENIRQAGTDKNSVEIKEEIINTESNNDIDEEIGDFPIEDKNAN
jgi:hypothetical protein